MDATVFPGESGLLEARRTMELGHGLLGDGLLGGGPFSAASGRADGEAVADALGVLAGFEEIFQQADAGANAVDALGSYAASLFGAADFALYRFDGAGQRLVRLCGAQTASGAHDSVRLSERTSPIARCAREKSRLTIAGLATSAARQAMGATSLIAPVVAAGRLLGVLSVQTHLGQTHLQQGYASKTGHLLSLLCLCAGSVLAELAYRERLDAAVLALGQAQREKQAAQAACEKLTEACHTDPLTGLRNRRFLQDQIAADVSMCLRRHEQARLARSAPPDADLLFFMVDIDHFKEINDTHGHAVGDMLLLQMRDCLKQAIREGDYLIRWGGEEFLVVAREADRRNAEAMAERLREVVEAWRFDLPGGLHLRRTCSVGFACYPYLRERPQMLGWTDVVELADSQLYRAKSNGRNAWAGLHGGDNALVSLASLLGQQESATAGDVRLVASAAE